MRSEDFPSSTGAGYAGISRAGLPRGGWRRSISTGTKLWSNKKPALFALVRKVAATERLSAGLPEKIIKRETRVISIQQGGSSAGRGRRLTSENDYWSGGHHGGSFRLFEPGKSYVIISALETAAFEEDYKEIGAGPSFGEE